MLLTLEQKAARARMVRNVHLIGVIKCDACGGSMLPDFNLDEVGWQCILCPHSRLWNIPDAAGFMHLRPDPTCRKLTVDEMTRLYQRFVDRVSQIEIVREFSLSRQAVVHLKQKWRDAMENNDGHSEDRRDHAPHEEPQYG